MIIVTTSSKRLLREAIKTLLTIFNYCILYQNKAWQKANLLMAERKMSNFCFCVHLLIAREVFELSLNGPLQKLSYMDWFHADRYRSCAFRRFFLGLLAKRNQAGKCGNGFSSKILRPSPSPPPVSCCPEVGME